MCWSLSNIYASPFGQREAPEAEIEKVDNHETQDYSAATGRDRRGSRFVQDHKQPLLCAGGQLQTRR